MEDIILILPSLNELQGTSEPMYASIEQTPTVLISVVFPDMFEPVIRAMSDLMVTELLTAESGERSGWQISFPSKYALSSAESLSSISGNELTLLTNEICDAHMSDSISARFATDW